MAPHIARIPRIFVCAGMALALMAGDAMAQQKGAPQPKKKAAAAAVDPGPPPLADVLTGMAKAEYEAGKVLYQDKDYANAIIKFQRAYELSNDPRLLLNVAICAKNLRRYTLVFSTLDKLKEDKSPLLTDGDRQAASELAKTVLAFVSPLKLTVNEAGAAVFVDDDQVGTTPLTKEVLLDVGKRRIRVTKPGYKEYVHTGDVAGGTDYVLNVELEKEIHRGRLSVVAGAEDLISLDGKMVGRGRWEGTVPSGGHTLRVTAPGMAAHQSEVLVQDNKRRDIQVTLNPLPSSGGSTWIWIAGGAGLLVAGGITAAFLFQPTAAPIPQGTLGTFPLSFGGKR